MRAGGISAVAGVYDIPPGMKRIVFAAVLTAVVAVIGVCRAEMPAGKFTHKMPASTNEKPTNPRYDEMSADFADPFGKVQTGVYWYWIAGNISGEGVRKDLVAMKRAGIGRAYIGDIGGSGNRPGPVKTFSPEWEKALATAFTTATELGMEIGIFNSPGWSQSVGPWVKPEQAMRRLVSSSVVVEGPCDGVKLPKPKFECAPAGHYEVCDLWVNRLIGDRGDPKRPTWTSMRCYDRGGKLKKAGLIGPVKLELE